MVPKMKERIEIRDEQPSLPPSSPPSGSGKAEELSDGEHSSDFETQDDTLPPKKRRKVSSSSRSPSLSSPLSTPGPLSQLSVSTISAFPTPPRIKKKQPQNANGTHSGQVEPDPVTSQDARDLGLQVTDSTFADLNVAPWLVNSLSTMAIRRPTAIQRACIPELLKGRDCIGGSRTGSGKTVAFAVPILQMWAEDPFGTFAVILTPTRELALQIFEQFKAISAPQNLKAALITGGTEMRPQAITLSQRPHVVIATPGRLADLIQTAGEDTTQSLTRVRMVVLDEADRLLSSGPGSMLPDVEICLSKLPPSSSRQTLLFTATVTPEVRALKSMARPAGRPPVFVTEVSTEDEASIPPTLKQTYLQTPMTHREVFLHVLLSTEGNSSKTAIIFCNRTKTADMLERMLRRLSHRVTSLHSLLPQSERIANLSRFRASAARILVATDVASRGLDIPTVKLVVNFDVPRNPDDYVHRVGRTARAGREGEAITLVGQRDVELVLAIEKRVGRQMVEWKEEGVSVEGRVVRTGALKEVGEAKREALGEIEEGRDVLGRRVAKLKKIR